MTKKSTVCKGTSVRLSVGEVSLKYDASAKTFEQLLRRLEEISVELDSDTIGLDDAIALYEEGIALSKICNTKLSEARVRITDLKKNLEDLPAGDDQDNEE